MLATSDALFVSALMRVRTRAYQAGLRASGLISAQRDLGLTTKGHFFSALPDTLDTLVHTSRSSQNLPQISLEKRWKRENAKLDMALNLDAFAAGIEKAIGDEGSADGTDRQPILDIFKPVGLQPPHAEKFGFNKERLPRTGESSTTGSWIACTWQRFLLTT